MTDEWPIIIMNGSLLGLVVLIYDISEIHLATEIEWRDIQRRPQCCCHRHTQQIERNVLEKRWWDQPGDGEVIWVREKRLGRRQDRCHWRLNFWCLRSFQAQLGCGWRRLFARPFLLGCGLCCASCRRFFFNRQMILLHWSYFIVKR